MTDDEALDATPQPSDGPDGTSRWYPLRKEITELLRAAGLEPTPQLVQQIIKRAREWRPA